MEIRYVEVVRIQMYSQEIWAYSRVQEYSEGDFIPNGQE